MADWTDADVIGCPACRTILNAKAAGCADPWHADNRTADPASHTDAGVEAVAAWHSRWCGASSIRKRDRAYAREVLSVLAAAGRDYAAGVAEGRRLAAEAIRRAQRQAPKGSVIDDAFATAARIAEGGRSDA